MTLAALVLKAFELDYKLRTQNAAIKIITPARIFFLTTVNGGRTETHQTRMNICIVFSKRNNKTKATVSLKAQSLLS